MYIFHTSCDENNCFESGKCVWEVAALVWQCLVTRILNEPQHDKTNKMTCAPSEDSDQLEQPLGWSRIFIVHMKKPWVLSCPLFLFDFSEINIYSIWDWNFRNNFSWRPVRALYFDIGALILMAFGYWWSGSRLAERLLPMIGLLSMIGMPSMIDPCRRLLPVHLINDTRGPDTGHKHQGCMARETDQLTWTKMINHQDVHPMWPLEFLSAK